MRLDEIPVPEPGPGQVRIRNAAAAINFFDILQIQGKYQVKPPFPFTPGAECAGVVDAVGPGVNGLKPGDRVTAMVHNGGYAEYALCDAYRVFHIPDRMSFPEAASLPIVYHTSYFALRTRANLQPGEWLLVHAGASGVGMSAIQIGKAMGARVIATAGSEAKLEFSRRQGAEHAFTYNTPEWADEVKRITGRGADVIYDPVGGDVFDLSTKCIAPDGRLLVVGFTSGRIPSIAANRILLKNISIVGVHWGASAAAREGVMGEAQTALETMYLEGKIRPAVSKEYPLAEAKAALADAAGRRLLGKAVLMCG